MSADLVPWRFWVAIGTPVVMLFAMASAVRETPDARIVEGRTTARVGAYLFAALSAAAVALKPSLWEAMATMLFLGSLAHLAVFDLRTLSVPIAPIAVMACLGVTVGFWDGWIEGISRGAAAAVGWASFTAIAWVYQVLRGRSGLGAGDGWVAALLGAWLSFEGLAWSVALGGAALLAWAWAQRAPVDQPAPFAPGLAIGALFVSLAGVWERGS